jgi:hemerythrin superfamily protein
MGDEKTAVVPPAVTRYYGPFSFRGLLTAVRDGMKREGYDEVDENSYKHKVGGEGTDVEVKLESDRKQNDYVKFKMNVEIKISEMKDVEVVHEGEKMKMQHGRVQATVTETIELDYQKGFESSPFLLGLRKFYHDFLIKTKIEEDYWYASHQRVQRLSQLIRQTLGFEIHG